MFRMCSRLLRVALVTSAPSPTVELDCINEIHQAVVAVRRKWIHGVASVLLGKRVDVLTGAVVSIVRLANTPLDLDPMSWHVWIDHQQADRGIAPTLRAFLVPDRKFTRTSAPS